MTTKSKLQNFKKVLNEQGEMFFTHGSDKKDYEYIQALINRQGYWSGIYNRFYFDDNFNLTAIESRF